MRIRLPSSAVGALLIAVVSPPSLVEASSPVGSDEGGAMRAAEVDGVAKSSGVVGPSAASRHLRSRRLAYGYDCGCPSTCTEQALNAYGGNYKCGDRINYLVSVGWNRDEACLQVAGVEFPADCGGCDPQACIQEPAPPTPSPCGCDSCTQQMLNTAACDLSGCYTCGGRINWLMNDAAGPKLSEYDACIRVAHDEFPNGTCGPGCDPLSCNAAEQSTAVPMDAPTKTPTQALMSIPTAFPTTPPMTEPTSVPTKVPVPATTAPPTMAPIPAPTVPAGPSPCGCESCTQEVLNTMAGGYSCGNRINWLQSPDGGSFSEQDACSKVAGNEFPDMCDPCDPAMCNPVYLADPDPSKLVWSDEFDDDGSPDPTKWTYDIGGSGWGNSELQHYTDRIDNAYVSNGALHIRAVKENYQGNDYTSARAVTRGLGDWTYGRVRVRARMDKCTALGTWPAIWMLPTDWSYGGWPSSGEIDIMEHVGYDTGRVHGTVHTDAFNHMIGSQAGKSIATNVADWHVYEILWDADKIEFAMDGLKYHEFGRVPPPEGTFKEWPFDQRFHLILNVAVGGSWGGVQGVDSSAFEDDGQIMEVDWVRVYSI